MRACARVHNGLFASCRSPLIVAAGGKFLNIVVFIPQKAGNIWMFGYIKHKITIS